MKNVQPPATGDTFGRWTVTGTPVWQSPGHRAVPCRCQCGTERIVLVFALRSGKSFSCGCWQADKSAARTGHPLYSTWGQMIQRCENRAAPNYPRYGARGIAVCDQWHDAGQFIQWIEANLGPRPPGGTLDRIDNDGNYEPGNVRWATPAQQQHNTRRYTGGPAAAYALSLPGAVRHRQPWADAELEIAARDDLTLEQAAAMTGRTLYAVTYARYQQRRQARATGANAR